MALRSMTGYGFAKGVAHSHAISVEARSVNYKGLDVKVQLPPWAQALETRLVRFARTVIGRGRLMIRVEIVADTESEGAASSINLSAARARMNDLELLRSTLNLESPVTLDHILAFPDIFHKPEELADPEKLADGVTEVVAQALEKLNQERTREGVALLNDLSSRLETVASNVTRIAEIGPELQKHHFDRLRERLAEALQHASAPELFEERMFQETVLFAERCDIAEEITRSTTHLETLRDLMDRHDPPKDGPVGKKLDFYLQELIRETNTTGAKSQSAVIANSVVVIRSEIDRMREQVLNVE